MPQKRKKTHEEGKTTFGDPPVLFFKKGSRKPFACFPPSGPILEALILIVSMER